jgi:hypothetical protein
MSFSNQPLRTSRNTAPTSRLSFNADAVAIIIALALAALLRFNVIHHIAW